MRTCTFGIIILTGLSVVTLGQSTDAVDRWGSIRLLAFGQINSVGYSPDGLKLAVASSSAVHILDTATLTVNRELFGHTSWVSSVAWSPDGQLLATASMDGSIKLWNATTFALLTTLVHFYIPACSIAWSPDSRRLAAGFDDGAISIWKADTFQLLSTFGDTESGAVVALAWSPDGVSLAAGGSQGSVLIWNPDTFVVVRYLYGHGNALSSVAWSPDSRRLATASFDQTIKVWNAVTFQNITTLTPLGYIIYSVVWSPDGQRFASGHFDGTIKVWNATNYRLLSTIAAHDDDVTSVAWSNDGRQIVSGSNDSTIKVWSSSTFQQVAALNGTTGKVHAVAWSPDSRRVAAGYGWPPFGLGLPGNPIYIWNADTYQLLATLTGHTSEVFALAWSDDGRKLVSGSRDNTLMVWNMDTYLPIATLSGHTSAVKSVSWSPDGLAIASGSNDGTVMIWSGLTYDILATLAGHSSWVSSVAWSPDLSKIVSGSFRELRIWNANNYQLITVIPAHTSDVSSIAWSPDARKIVSASWDGNVGVWDATTYAPLPSPTGHKDSALSISWSPEGLEFASSSYREVSIWDAETSALVATVTNYTDWVNSVKWSPDGRRLLTGSSEGAVRLQKRALEFYLDKRNFIFNGTQGCTNPPNQILSITHTGDGVLNWSVSSDRPWLLVTPPSGTSPSQIAVAVNMSGLLSGTYIGTITVTAATALIPVNTATVTLVVGNQIPIITMTPTAATFQAVQSGPNPACQTGSITNTGGGTLNWTASSNQPWLSISPQSAVAPSQVSLCVSSGGLLAGNYTGTITVTSTCAANSPQSIPVNLRIDAPPRIVLSPTSLSFRGTQGCQNPTNQTLSLTNGGGGTLSWTAVTDSPWLTVSPALGTAPSQVAVSVNTSALTAGNYSGTITINAPGAVNTPQTATVSLTVDQSPVITTNPFSLSFLGAAGRTSPACQTINITNTGGATLDWTARSDQLWLSVSPQSGSAPSQVSVCVNTGGLVIGDYTGSITIASACAANSPQTASIALSVVSAPHIDVDITGIVINSVQGGPNPPVQTMTLGNSGGASFTWSVATTATWLSALPTSGSLGAGAMTQLSFSVNISGLTAGSYTGALRFSAAAADNSPQTVPITLVIAPPPRIDIDPTPLIFAAMQGGPNPAAQVLTLGNIGGGPFTWTATTTPGWLSVLPASGTLASGATTTLSLAVNITGLTAGSYAGSLRINAAEADNSPQTVPITLVIAPRPRIDLDLTPLVFSAMQGGPNPAAQVLTLGNIGGGPFTWSASTTPSWLSVFPASGTLASGATTTLSLAVNITGLTAGSYAGSLRINAAEADNSPQTVPITLIIAPRPRIDIDPTPLVFSAMQGGPSPAAQVITMGNIGGGPFTWSASTTPGWLSVLPQSGTLAPGALTQLSLSVNITGILAGSYTGSLRITSPEADNSPQTIAVTLAVAPPPRIDLDTTPILFSAILGGPIPGAQTRDLGNIGGGPFSWTATSTAAWLSIIPTSGISDPFSLSQLTVSANVGGLVAGTYNGTIRIDAPQADNSPQVVAVTLTVSPPP
ncbi:MAG: hypothetical protein HYR55_14275 [Acidobacteria bacterium]|nr:hypothetical protein [Acidobacteriota bacterium]MBI3658634.1 hypothetical protein [Acidobacteriota bacterium]